MCFALKRVDSSLEVVGFTVYFFVSMKSHSFGNGITNVFVHLWRFKIPLCRRTQQDHWYGTALQWARC